MADGMHQVGFSKTGAAVDIKRVVGFSWRFCHGKRCGMRKFIIASNDKGVKFIFAVEIGSFVTEIVYAFF